MKRLSPTGCTFKVPVRDSTPTEFEVQAYLYSALKAAGLDVRGEITFRNPKTRENYRFDIVIYEYSAPKEIVEVKAMPVRHKNGVENTRQANRYRNFGIPVVFVYGLEDADSYIQDALR